MASEDQLLAAAAAAKPFAAAGEEVVGVLVADPFEHGLVFLCALGPPADDDGHEDADDVPELGWIAVDPGGLALADARRVQEAAMLAALCETAEEAALVPEAAEIAAPVDRALGLAGDERPELRAALDATREAALAAAVYDDGLRVARTGYVDQLGDAARALGASARQSTRHRPSRFDGRVFHVGFPLPDNATSQDRIRSRRSSTACSTPLNLRCVPSGRLAQLR